MAVVTEAPRPVRAALLQKVCGDAEMFALGASVSRVVQMASSEDEGTNDLAYYVLSDAALTQRILRMSNTAQYRTASGSVVTTISRAISLLGFDNVKTTALAMLLVDALGKQHASAVRAEVEASLCASLVGRQMARRSFYQGAEEASIGALFKNLGSLLIASHELDRYREVQTLLNSGKHTLPQASQMILGCTYDALTEAVLQEWKIPDAIKASTAPLGAGALKQAASKGEWMRQVASFSADLARTLGKNRGRLELSDIKTLEQRYGTALNVDAETLTDLASAVQEEMGELMRSLNLKPQDEADDHGHGGLPNVLLLATMDDGDPEPNGHHPSGKPLNARELLLAGVQDVTQMRASGQYRVNELIQTVLEVLYRSMGFRFATVCLKDLRSNQYRARVAFGEDHVERQAGFAFPMASSRDLFHLSMENDADLMIADSHSPKIRELVPAWHRALLPDARSFIVLPLVVNQVQLGLFYADRERPAPEGVPPDETSLIKALKSQVLVALSP